MDTSFDPVGYVLRVRRLLDLSQRDLAQILGVSASTVGRWESRSRPIGQDSLVRVLRLAALQLAVVDENGAVVAPVPRTTVRDNGGRRFPAHLDADPPDQVPWPYYCMPRRDRPPVKAWYHHRAERERLAAEHPHRARPVDHPTVEELALRRRLIRGRQPVVDPPPSPDLDCRCLDQCFELACLGPCPCQCEPRRTFAELRQLPMRVRTS